MITNGKMIKSALALGVSLTIAFTGTVVLQPDTVHAATVSSSLASKIIQSGERFMGVPYRYGSKTGDTSHFDCSSFVQYVYRLHGVTLPRSSREQSKAGKYVSKSNLQPGDLVFFYSPIHHVAIYIGNGKILHTYGKPGVTISDLNSGWWSSHYATARRVLPSSGQVSTPAPTLAPTTAPTQAKTTAVKTASSSGQTALVVKGVNFRTAPSTDSRVIGLLHEGERLQILSKVNAYWYRIKTSSGKIGYVTTMEKYIQR